MSTDSLARRGAGFGLIAAAASGPGQTYFIGFFGAAFRESFGLTEAGLGTLYGIATLASGVLMFWLGELADRLTLRRAITFSVALLAAGAVLGATASSPLQLGLSLFLLRLGGQGLTGHFAVVAAARFSTRQRGRGVATASMGFILGEALYPMLISFALDGWGWRVVWWQVAAILILLYLPALRLIARPFPAVIDEASEIHTAAPEMTLNRRRLFASPAFLGTVGILVVPPVVITAMFFHQSTMGLRVGWSMELVARAFIGFAAAQAVSTLVAGRLVDRFGALMLMRFHLLPLAGGLAALLLLRPGTSLWALFCGLGLTAGGNSVIAGAVWAEIFGIRRLGLVRGVYAAVMVISTAVSPALLGALLSAGVSLQASLLPAITYAIIAPWLLVPLVQKHRPAAT